MGIRHWSITPFGLSLCFDDVFSSVPLSCWCSFCRKEQDSATLLHCRWDSSVFPARIWARLPGQRWIPVVCELSTTSISQSELAVFCCPGPTDRLSPSNKHSCGHIWHRSIWHRNIWHRHLWHRHLWCLWHWPLWLQPSVHPLDFLQDSTGNSKRHKWEIKPRQDSHP